MRCVLSLHDAQRSIRVLITGQWYSKNGKRAARERMRTNGASLSFYIALPCPMAKLFHSTEEEVESLIRLGEAILVLILKQ